MAAMTPPGRSPTYSRSFLVKTAVGILVGGLVLAVAADALAPVSASRPRMPERVPLFERVVREAPGPETWLDPWLASERTDLGDVLDALPELLIEPSVGGPDGLRAALERALPEGGRRELATLVLRAGMGEAEALAELVGRAAADDAPRYTSYALALALPPSAARVAALEQEIARHDSDRARRRVLDTLVALGDDAALAQRSSDPAYAAVADATIPYRQARRRLDWVGLLVWMGPAQHARVSPVFIVLGALSGLLWLAFLAWAGEVRSLRSSRLVLCIAAVVLGALSTVPTLVLDVWMEEVLGIQQSTDLRGGVAYFIASVGLREELCKLVFFLPLAPIVIRRRAPLEMLVVAGCVGLGFAAEENVSYFAGSGGGAAAGRFLTANFGHIVDTGLIGFAFCRMFIEPGRITDFLLTFVLIVIGHGIYDALIIVPALEDWSALSATIYVAVAYVYFGELRRHASPGRRPVSLTFVFVAAFTTLLALSLAASSWELGLAAASAVMVPGALGAAMFVFVFFRQIDEPLLP